MSRRLSSIPLLIILSCVSFTFAPAQDTMGTSAMPKGVVADSTAHSSFLEGVGYVGGKETPERFIHRSRFQWTDTYYLGGLLHRQPGVLIRGLGEPGFPQQVLLRGTDARLFLDGIPLHDPVTDLANLYHLPLEHVEAVGTDDPVFSALRGVDAGHAVDLVSRQWWTTRPVTKLRFLQGPNEHLLTDGTFSQNVTRSVNLTAGFQRHVADGRYPRAGFESWNLRARLRWNPAETFNGMVSYFLTSSSAGMNGGVLVDSSLSVFEPASAAVRLTSAHEETDRHDLSALIALRPFADTLWSTTARLSLTSAERSYTDPVTPSWNAAGSYSWIRWGLRLEQRIEHSFHATLLSFHHERLQAASDTLMSFSSLRRTALAAQTTIRVLDLLVPTVSVKGELINNSWFTSAGVGARVPVLNFISVEGGASRSFSPPSLRTMNRQTLAGRGLSDMVERHDAMQIAARARWVGGSVCLAFHETRLDHRTGLRFSGFSTTEGYPALQAVTEGKVTIRGAELGLAMRLWRFELEGAVTYQSIASAVGIDPGIPEIAFFGEAMWADSLFDGNLGVRCGIRARSAGSMPAVYYHPALSVFSSAGTSSIAAFTQIDLVAVVRIGDAFLQLTWENVANKEHFMVPTYPLPDSNVKLGVNWVFID